jgi:hypothetical protein
MDGETLREGLFALNTRRFGSVAEVLIKRLKKLGKARNLFHDLYDDLASKRVEVKFSRALKKSNRLVTEDSVLKCIEEATSEKRLVTWNERRTVKFDCNIQQIKKTEFDHLYYGVFFSDCVTIFHIESVDIGSQIHYSHKQHKGNIGEGQFHINQDSILAHEQNYLYQKLSYEKLNELLS